MQAAAELFRVVMLDHHQETQRATQRVQTGVTKDATMAYQGIQGPWLNDLEEVGTVAGHLINNDCFSINVNF